jgi:hypothetical protein
MQRVKNSGAKSFFSSPLCHLISGFMWSRRAVNRLY